MALPSNVILNIPIVASVVGESPLTVENNQFDIGISCIMFFLLTDTTAGLMLLPIAKCVFLQTSRTWHQPFFS